jgi:preprotein translocase subunit SecG
MVITFIIVILVIVISVIVIGVTFSTIKSQQNTSGIVSGNNNQNSCKYLFLLFNNDI